MKNNPLLAGVIGFLLGGLLVSVAAVTFDKPKGAKSASDAHYGMQATQDGPHDKAMTMRDMVGSLEGKSGDSFDKAFIAGMIEHHEGAVGMAKLAAEKAKHQEIKTVSEDIITAQQKEIEQMRQWQKDWGY